MTTRIQKQILKERARIEKKLETITAKAEPLHAQLAMLDKVLEDMGAHADPEEESETPAVPAFLVRSAG